MKKCRIRWNNCKESINAQNSSQIFASLNVSCKMYDPVWCCEDQPSFEPSTGKCLGYVAAPQAVACQGSYPTTQRVCTCAKPTKNPSPFGTGYSVGYLSTQERTKFTWVLTNDGTIGVMTHFWITTGPPATEVMLNYYVDDEVSPSIQYQPSLASGVGFSDDKGPWGDEMVREGSSDGRMVL